ncbi:transglycosylase SLT domain-containing protein [Rhodococcus hoagii]|nr:transglycosylase SLT domain-containing protein [Prescottella equi]MBM4654049.1 transglycosylase SLT domain-containing protein [Prescottella equi]MBM4719688.1 transglycosylase SLT domain-containing protein [Prescottella equi]NKR23485.1 transglycosylase SLT domain-containing protein [Prescottella equi]NKT56361.1 transglycosylase SLT domain-containing protein [Prescottella equi]
MTDIAVDADNTVAALDRGRAQVGEVIDQTEQQAPQVNDPKVAELLRELSNRTGADAERANEHADSGAAAAQGLADADSESAATVAGAAAPVGGADSSGPSRVSAATLPQATAGQQAQQQQLLAQQQQQQQLAQQFAQQQAQQQQQMAAAAQQQQMVAAAQQAAMAMAPPSAGAGAFPDGTILVDPNDLAALIDSSGGSGSLGSSAGSSWNGSTAPEPIDVGDVEYEKTHGVMSPEQKSAVIDSALDKTGITDPDARSKWKEVLSYMSEEESGDNPSAVNNWDTNAVGPTQVDGSPAQSSRGPWQTIPTTFAAHHAAGTSTNIYDPEASAGAAINYMKSRYNIGDDGSGLDEFYAARAHGRYVGY